MQQYITKSLSEGVRTCGWKMGRMLLSMLKIGVAGFGGGSALIPVIEDEVVNEQHLLSKKEYDEDVVSACITPGALPVEIAAGNGYRTFGLSGMILAALAIAFPGAFITIIIVSLLSGNAASGSLDIVRYLSVGIGAFICSLLVDYAVKTQKTISSSGKKSARISLMVIAGVFLLTCGKNLYAIIGLKDSPIINLSTVEVLALAFFVIFYTGCRFTKKNAFAAGGIGILYILFTGSLGADVPVLLKSALYVIMAVLSLSGIIRSMRRDAEDGNVSAAINVNAKGLLRQCAVWLVFLAAGITPALLIMKGSFLFVVKGFLSSLISFGGGDAYLSVADGMFVGFGMVSTEDFYGTLVPAANVLPGSILCKILSGVGYFTGLDAAGSVAGGWAAALAGFAVSVAASGMIFCMVRWLFEVFGNVSIFQQISKWIRPIISGLLLNVTLTMIRTNVDTGVQIGAGAGFVIAVTGVIIAVDLFLMKRKKIGNGALIAASAAVGSLMLVF